MWVRREERAGEYLLLCLYDIDVLKKSDVYRLNRRKFDKYIRYIIIKFRRGEKKYNDMELILGPILIKNVIENKDYLEEKYEENKKILKNIPSVYLKKRIYLKKINKFIKKLLSTVS